MLRAVSKTISEPLAVLFNRSFSEGIFPEAWKMAGLIPIPKKRGQNIAFKLSPNRTFK